MNEEIPASFQYLPYFDVIILTVSAASGLVVVLVLIGLALHDSKLVDRLSLRFTFAISFVDFLKALLTLIYIFYNIEGPACTSVALFIPILSLMYMFLTMAIAANLQLVFLHGIVFNPKWEYFYWGISLGLPFAIMALPLGMGQLGIDESSGACWYKNSGEQDGFAWIMSTLIVWIVLGCIYCTVIVILTIISLNKKVIIVEKISESEPSSNGSGVNTKKHQGSVQIALERLIRRILLYCLIPIVSQMGYVIENIVGIITGESYEFIAWWSTLGTGSPGVLNLIAFLLDPALYTALKTIRDRKYASTSHQNLEEIIDVPIRMIPDSRIRNGSFNNIELNNIELNDVNSTFDDLSSFDEYKIIESVLVTSQSTEILTQRQSSFEENDCQISNLTSLKTMTYKQFTKGL